MATISRATPQSSLAGMQRLSLIVGGLGLLLTVIGYFVVGSVQFYQSWLFAFIFWTAVALGSLMLLMINHLTDGVWGLMIRRFLECGTRTLMLMSILFLPIIFGMRDIYPWMDAKVQANPVVAAKLPYLNTPGFIGRSLLMLGIWVLLQYLFNKWSSQEDAGDTKATGKMKAMAGPGIVIFTLTWMLAATDWGMSLEPTWFSSMYPVSFIPSMVLLSFCGSVLLLNLLNSRKLLPFSIPVDRLHDLGKFMFAFIILWTYVNFSEYLIIWSGNIPDEAEWYMHRLDYGWQYLAIINIFGHFFVPFFLLLSRHPKRNINVLSGISIYIIVIELLWYFWKVVPSFHPESFQLSWTDVSAWIGMGGLWMAFFFYNLAQRPILAPNDPRVPKLMKQIGGGDGHSHGAGTGTDHNGPAGYPEAAHN